MTRKRKSTYLLSIKALLNPVGRIEVLKVILIQQGVREEDIIEVTHYPYKKLTIYFSSIIKARQLKAKLEQFNLDGISLKLQLLRKKDWEKKGKEDFRPFQLTPNLDVVPKAFKNKYRSKKRERIYLETGLAFGTGLHESTRFMAQLIDQSKGRFENFLDIGTGTGILSLVALKCGAKKVSAIDLSKDCIKTAKANMMNNGFSAKGLRSIHLNKFSNSVLYDFVVANLLTKDLIDHGRKIISFVKPNGYLAVSGISKENFSFFKQAIAKFPLKCQRILKGRDWVAVLYRKRVSNAFS